MRRFLDSIIIPNMLLHPSTIHFARNPPLLSPSKLNTTSPPIPLQATPYTKLPKPPKHSVYLTKHTATKTNPRQNPPGHDSGLQTHQPSNYTSAPNIELTQGHQPQYPIKLKPPNHNNKIPPYYPNPLLIQHTHNTRPPTKGRRPIS
jgi:hypothetical protein